MCLHDTRDYAAITSDCFRVPGSIVTYAWLPIRRAVDDQNSSPYIEQETRDEGDKNRSKGVKIVRTSVRSAVPRVCPRSTR